MSREQETAGTSTRRNPKDRTQISEMIMRPFTDMLDTASSTIIVNDNMIKYLNSQLSITCGPHR